MPLAPPGPPRPPMPDPSLPQEECRVLFLPSRLPAVVPRDYQPELGDEYATAKANEQPVEAAPLGPDFIDYQTWRFEPAEIDGRYYVLYVPKYRQDPERKLGFHHEIGAIPGTPITLSDPSRYWVRIQAVTSNGDYIVTIQPTNTISSKAVADYVGVSKDSNNLVTERVQAQNESTYPGWYVTPRGWVAE
ncbi:hypothetical protein FRC07_006599 [Ceratobasidium sp. 392]|nr:hypothetical protein FRC07_006599 [Ceratobasidium sp. 392]